MFKSYRKLNITTVGSAFLSCALMMTACNATEPAESVKKVADTTKDAVKVTAAKVTEKVKEVATTATATAKTSGDAVVAIVSDKMGGSRTYANGKFVIGGGMTYPIKDNKSGAYYENPQDKKGFVFGRTPTKNEIAAWDIDIMPDGTGLPEGSGTVEEGDEIYEAKCVSCHGDFGSGGGGYPSLSKGNAYEGQKTLTNQRLNPDDGGPTRTFGSYWPYASTLWWYIKTGMPHNAPLSLSDDDVYALTAYMLAINEIKIDGEELDDEYELNREKFLKIVMPNKDGFIPSIDGKDGLENVRAFYHDTSNYGNGTRCMKDCFEGEPKIQGITIEMKDFNPPLSNVKDLPKEDPNAAPITAGQKTYEAVCALCHSTDSMGAPEAGNKAAWDKVMEQGIETVYDHAINGFNGMPAKGGQTSLSDEAVKEAVDYILEKSK